MAVRSCSVLCAAALTGLFFSSPVVAQVYAPAFRPLPVNPVVPIAPAMTSIPIYTPPVQILPPPPPPPVMYPVVPVPAYDDDRYTAPIIVQPVAPRPRVKHFYYGPQKKTRSSYYRSTR